MGKIFVSYRRDDSQHITDRIFDHLLRHFDRRSLFKDVDNIPAGVDFRTHVVNAVAGSDVVLVVIGPAWLGRREGAGTTRIQDPNDPVAMEVGAALTAGRKVLPVLVGGARMPAEAELPAALKQLAAINAVHVRPDPDFNNDFNRLRSAVAALAETDPHNGRRWLWPAVAAAAAAAVAAVVFYAALPKLMPDSRSPAPASGSMKDAPPLGKANCREYLFTDNSKVPPVVTKRWDCD